MSAPIDLQLSGYTEFFDSQLPIIDLDDVLTERVGTDPVRPLRPRRPQRQRQWLVAAAAVVAVLILVGGVAWLFRSARGVTPVDQPTTTVAASSLAWSRVPHDVAVLGGSGDQWMLSVTAGGPGLVAVGIDRSGGDSDAAVWTSPDGIIWSRVPHDEMILGGAPRRC